MKKTKATNDQPESNGTDEKYYYADGQKIPLGVSTRFLAVGAAGAGATARGAAESVVERLPALAAPVQVLEVPEYNLAVVALPQDATTARTVSSGILAGVQSMIEADGALTSGPPVYEPLAGGAAAALIPVGEILVKFKASASQAARQQILDKNRLVVKRADYPESGILLVASQSEADIIDLANSLEEDAQVEFAEPNFVHVSARPSEGVSGGVGARPALVPPEREPSAEEAETGLVSEAFPTLTATDPAFASQWNLQKIKAPAAWDISTGNSAISVAIIDEGCDATHEDIAYKLPGYDAYSGDNDPQPNGNDAHGTACAGVAAMRMNNGRGGAGVAPGCRVVPIRIAQGVGGGFWSTTSAKVADGIRKAVDGPRNADVLSNSYGVSPSTVVTDAFKYAQTNGRGGKGCPVAAAAGNSNTPPVLYPARLASSIPGFMAVSATNEWDQRKSKTSLDGETWWGSSYGPEVDIAAPGVHIYSPDIMGGAGYGSGNYIPNFNGTSSATPHVAGLMALILSVDPDLRSWEVEEIIKLTADDLGPAGRDQEFGFGRINCRRALEAASRLWYEVSIVPEFIGAGKECFMRANIRMYNPGINTIRLDALTLTSHNPSWTAELDRFEYRPNPGNVLAPRTSQDVRCNKVLLKAVGNQSSWSFQWALNWSYTFWRPSAPGLPLAAPEEITQSGGVRAEAGRPIKGSRSGGSQPTGGAEHSSSNGQPGLSYPSEAGDVVAVDRQSKTITIVVR